MSTSVLSGTTSLNRNVKRPFFRELRVVTSSKLKTLPALFRPIAHLRENNKRTCIRKHTDLVVEGYWRCGNHFAAYAFEAAQGRRVHVAHHFHAPAQLILATRWNVPAVLLIREPIAAIASATVYLETTNPRPLIQFYNIFHRALMPYRDKFVVANFEQTTTDFGSVIERINRRYGKSYAAFTHSPKNEQRIRDRIQEEHWVNMGGNVSTLPLPSEAKSKLKAEIVQQLRSGAYDEELAEANALYHELLTCSTADAKRPVRVDAALEQRSVEPWPVGLKIPANAGGGEAGSLASYR